MNVHASNLFHVQCRIPYAKDELLSHIDGCETPPPAVAMLTRQARAA